VVATRDDRLITGYIPVHRIPHPPVAYMAAQCAPGDPAFMTVVVDHHDADPAAYWLSCLVDVTKGPFFEILTRVPVSRTMPTGTWSPADDFDPLADV
jgi:hypothetical protein